jgi:adenylate cyclase
VQRRLTVIFSADVVGYSTLMQRDEAGTLSRLKANRKAIFDPCVTAKDGRVVKLMGDGALVEFGSVVSAIACAREIQEATEADRSAPETDRIHYRIGITLGEVIVEGDDIYGDGVNMAARLQALAPPGGVTVSRTVRDQAMGKVEVEFDDLGERAVKNIERPVQVFALRIAPATVPPSGVPQPKQRLAICVLPFANMSGDPEQEYFSDGITEDIITDLSKVSALWVAARNTAFTFKGKQVDAPQIARQLNVSHLLEGSVRKAGGRVRITAQLIDGATGGHIWAERYDRELKDIFALQDEISQAIVAALKLSLLPEEKRAIEQRGTTNSEAYKLYLMAREYSVRGNAGAARANEAIIRLCRRATEIDPNYARAWAMMAGAQRRLRLFLGREGDGGLAAAERALSLDPTLAEAHAAKARILTADARYDEARREIEVALRLDPESNDVNQAAATWHFSQRRFGEAITYYERAASSMEPDFYAAGMVLGCYKALGDMEGAQRAARRVLAHAERILAVESDNGSAMSFLVEALMVLGEVERAKEWIERATLLDPDNMNMRYNFACALISNLREFEAALNLLGPVFEKVRLDSVNWFKVDPDLDLIRDHPRFKAMLGAAEARLAKS